MSVVNKNMTQNRQISSILSKMGFSRKTMRKYIKRRLIVDDSTLEGNWLIMHRAPCSDRIDNTHPSSSSRDVIRHRNTSSQYEHHAKH